MHSPPLQPITSLGGTFIHPFSILCFRRGLLENCSASKTSLSGSNHPCQVSIECRVCPLSTKCISTIGEKLFLPPDLLLEIEMQAMGLCNIYGKFNYLYLVCLYIVLKTCMCCCQ